MQPLRSVLFLPASNARAIAKAHNLDVDAIIMDLEDAVAPDMKVDARQAACMAVWDDWGHRQVAIRVNAPGTAWYEADVQAVSQAKPDVLVIPKLESAKQVHEIVQVLDEKTKIWGMIETPKAVLEVSRILADSPVQLTGVIMGTNDLVKELGSCHVPGRAPLQYALQSVLLAAKAFGKVALDGVFNDIKDGDGFAAQCREAAQMGFDGKTLIHPNQIEIANQIWAPNQNEVADAQDLIDTFESALAAGLGVVTYKGKMIENLHVESARRVLELNAAIAARQHL